MVRGLLRRTPESRLGATPQRLVAFKGLGIFRKHCIGWDDLLAKRVSPPLLPAVGGALDTSNFDKHFTSQMPVVGSPPSDKGAAMHGAGAKGGGRAGAGGTGNDHAGAKGGWVGWWMGGVDG